MACAGVGLIDFLDFPKASGIWCSDVTVNSTVLKNVYCWRSNLLEQFLQSAVRKGFRHESACYGLQCVSFRWVIDLLCTCVILSRWCETRYPGNLILIVLRSCWRRIEHWKETEEKRCKRIVSVLTNCAIVTGASQFTSGCIRRHFKAHVVLICGETNNSPRNNLYWATYTRLLRLKPSFNRPLSSTIIAFFLQFCLKRVHVCFRTTGLKIEMYWDYWWLEALRDVKSINGWPEWRFTPGRERCFRRLLLVLWQRQPHVESESVWQCAILKSKVRCGSHNFLPLRQHSLSYWNY